MAFSDPMIDNEVGFYKRKGEPLQFSDYTALKKEKVKIGTVRGYLNPKGFDEAGLISDPAPDDLTNIKKLLKGRIRLVITDK